MALIFQSQYFEDALSGSHGGHASVLLGIVEIQATPNLVSKPGSLANEIRFGAYRYHLSMKCVLLT